MIKNTISFHFNIEYVASLMKMNSAVLLASCVALTASHFVLAAERSCVERLEKPSAYQDATFNVGVAYTCEFTKFTVEPAQFGAGIFYKLCFGRGEGKQGQGVPYLTHGYDFHNGAKDSSAIGRFYNDDEISENGQVLQLLAKNSKSRMFYMFNQSTSEMTVGQILVQGGAESIFYSAAFQCKREL